MTDEQFLKGAEVQVDALNHALANVPADRVRMHICWGNYEGPHNHDLPLTAMLPLLFRAKPSALLIEGANPRHEHEWETWATLQTAGRQGAGTGRARFELQFPWSIRNWSPSGSGAMPSWWVASV